MNVSIVSCRHTEAPNYGWAALIVVSIEGITFRHRCQHHHRRTDTAMACATQTYNRLRSAA